MRGGHAVLDRTGGGARMTWGDIPITDWVGIALAERRRRWIEMTKANWNVEKRSAVDDLWADVCFFEFDLVELLSPEERQPSADRRLRDKLFEVVLQAAIKSVKRHQKDGFPRGEQEAHAYRLLALARRMAHCIGCETPNVGEILFVNSSERKAA